jgi:hypothetical protein
VISLNIGPEERSIPLRVRCQKKHTHGNYGKSNYCENLLYSQHINIRKLSGISVASSIIRGSSSRTLEHYPGNTYCLRFPPGLHNSDPPTVLLYGLNIVPKS